MSGFQNIFFLAIAALCLANGATCQKDETLTDRAKGKDVVEAVLRKLDRSGIFKEDNSFLIRLAYVESRFGDDPNTFRSNYFGGIWQVDQWRFDQTKNATLTSIHDRIQARFNINWPTVAWNDLTTPMHSGIAAALHFEGIPRAIPQTIAAQAAHWKSHYRVEEDVAKFIGDAEELSNQTRCRGKMDLAIVLDSSGSINQWDPRNYQRAKDFTANVIESFTLDYTRIGMLVYSNNVRDIFELNTTFTIPQMVTRARNAIYLDSGTRTDRGINRAIQMFNDVPEIEGTPKVMMVLTDGNSDRGSDLPGAVNAARDNNIKPISVGIGTGINNRELLLIALGDSRSVFQLADFSSLHDFLFQLTAVTCDVPQKPELNGTYDDSLVRGEKRIYQIEIPLVGITISINITVGSTRGYWSFSEEVPSSAVYDGIVEDLTYIPAPGSGGRRRREARQDGSGATVYFAIEGVDEMNSYSISAIEGKVNGGPPTVGLTSALIIGLMSIHFLFNFLY